MIQYHSYNIISIYIYIYRDYLVYIILYYNIYIYVPCIHILEPRAWLIIMPDKETVSLATKFVGNPPIFIHAQSV